MNVNKGYKDFSNEYVCILQASRLINEQMGQNVKNMLTTDEFGKAYMDVLYISYNS